MPRSPSSGPYRLPGPSSFQPSHTHAYPGKRVSFSLEPESPSSSSPSSPDQRRVPLVSPGISASPSGSASDSSSSSDQENEHEHEHGQDDDHAREDEHDLKRDLHYASEYQSVNPATPADEELGAMLDASATLKTTEAAVDDDESCRAQTKEDKSSVTADHTSSEVQRPTGDDQTQSASTATADSGDGSQKELAQAETERDMAETSADSKNKGKGREVLSEDVQHLAANGETSAFGITTGERQREAQAQSSHTTSASASTSEPVHLSQTELEQDLDEPTTSSALGVNLGPPRSAHDSSVERQEEEAEQMREIEELFADAGITEESARAAGMALEGQRQEPPAPPLVLVPHDTVPFYRSHAQSDTSAQHARPAADILEIADVGYPYSPRSRPSTTNATPELSPEVSFTSTRPLPVTAPTTTPDERRASVISSSSSWGEGSPRTPASPLMDRRQSWLGESDVKNRELDRERERASETATATGPTSTHMTHESSGSWSSQGSPRPGKQHEQEQDHHQDRAVSVVAAVEPVRVGKGHEGVKPGTAVVSGVALPPAEVTRTRERERTTSSGSGSGGTIESSTSVGTSANASASASAGAAATTSTVGESQQSTGKRKKSKKGKGKKMQQKVKEAVSGVLGSKTGF